MADTNYFVVHKTGESTWRAVQGPMPLDAAVKTASSLGNGYSAVDTYTTMLVDPTAILKLIKREEPRTRPL